MSIVSAQSAVSEFAEMHGARLTALCVSMAGNPHDGWDLVQATLERLLKAWARAVPDDPWAYAVRTATNLNIDRLRKLRREVLRDHVESPPVHVSIDESLSPEVREALGSLTVRQRTALALRHLEDMTIPEIAQTMGSSEGTIRSHLSRGSERLRISLQPPIVTEQRERRAQ